MSATLLGGAGPGAGRQRSAQRMLQLGLFQDSCITIFAMEYIHGRHTDLARKCDTFDPL